jgi:SAM-dependent methyltransferase
MMLSAHLRGFQCIWNAGIGDHAQLREMLGLPPVFELQGALAIGRAKASAPPMKAPRRPFAEVHSWERFHRPTQTIYPAKPADAYPYFSIRNEKNPFAEWDPARWSWEQVADFRGYSVWAKSPLVGVYVSRRQGEATAAELAMLPSLGAGAQVLEVMPWGGTYTVALRRLLKPTVALHIAELSPHNLSFIGERLRQEGLPQVGMRLMQGPTLPYGDETFDAVLLPQVLEHCPEPGRVLDEAVRLLKPGGALVVSARNMNSAYGRHWRRTESRAQVPNQGPFRPLPARQVRRWLAGRLRIEEEAGIGHGAVEDATVLRSAERFTGRLYAARAIRV